MPDETNTSNIATEAIRRNEARVAELTELIGEACNELLSISHTPKLMIIMVDSETHDPSIKIAMERIRPGEQNDPAQS